MSVATTVRTRRRGRNDLSTRDNTSDNTRDNAVGWGNAADHTHQARIREECPGRRHGLISWLRAFSGLLLSLLLSHLLCHRFPLASPKVRKTAPLDTYRGLLRSPSTYPFGRRRAVNYAIVWCTPIRYSRYALRAVARAAEAGAVLGSWDHSRFEISDGHEGCSFASQRPKAQ